LFSSPCFSKHYRDNGLSVAAPLDLPDYFDGFSWALPSAFADALALCRFEQGDVLYDTQRAYEGEWGTALRHIKYQVEVKFPLRGGGVKSSESEDSAFEDNWNSKVVIRFVDHRASSEREVTTTQGNLYSMLWSGDISALGGLSVPPPLGARHLMGKLAGVLESLRKKHSRAVNNSAVFVMPFDHTSKLLRSKLRTVESALQTLGAKRGVMAVKDLEIEGASAFAPTSCVVWFAMSPEHKSETVTSLLKRHLHKPSKDKKTDRENFNLKTHGLLAGN
jgi:hypothetical protein